MYRIPTDNEVTLLKRIFNKWGIFEVFKKSFILIKEYSYEKITSIDFNNNNISSKSKNDRIQVTSNLEYGSNKKSLIRGVFMFNSQEHKIDVLNNQPYHAGLLIGYLHKNFFPSLPFLEIIVAKGKSFSNIVIKDHAANLVLYGKDVFGDSILSCSKFEENTFVLILNSDRKPLGLGKTRYSSSNIQAGKVMVSTVSDFGKYLRDEDKSTEIFQDSI